MIAVVIGAVFGLGLTLVGTPLFIRFLVKRGYGQFIRDDGPTTHHVKRGTPTMGGAVIMMAVVAAYLLTHLLLSITGDTAGPTASGLLLLMLMVGMGLVGFADDFAKISRKQSLGLTPWRKIAGLVAVGVLFAVLALNFPDADGLTPASTNISFVRETVLDLAFAGPIIGMILFVIWANLIVTATTNGVNLTDGLDGLATAATAMVTAAYTIISIWQFNQACGSRSAVESVCYQVRDPMDMAMIAAIITGALIGFLWWNTSPAKIFMGDTGSLALGGALAGFAILTHTQLLFVILGGLFVLITLSVIIQVGYFKFSGGKRVFLMAPLQHHFELKGWAEVTVVVRFWIIGALAVGIGLAVFYGEWVIRQ
ncbi:MULTISPECIES: phospho-N-acetylmuramoyl-pentapeptide-transferase [unclassified Nesterenkonia]|uniref:phospho-N-acetylmuramoyl-pentapeptide- transferase n=1 Tax=unclassified Nesterenkonia TaxID=2629769 RepID=UPI001F4C56A1|nr:phospho-N-acetylmuramoyl-pentapeptide-transferase [Nesterenkonia sp. DZ6]MCH8561707.1 phospho-N-acetylmuramoyl-pentapeptide-transferase [Nesterenkonia sp. YGD6]